MDKHEVGRVIARPFTGEYPFERLTDQRKDFSAVPPENNLVQLLYNSGIKTYSFQIDFMVQPTSFL